MVLPTDIQPSWPHWGQGNAANSAPSLGLPCGSDSKESVCNSGDLGSVLALGRPPGEWNWLPTPVFVPRESHGQRSLEAYSPWNCRVGHDWATNTFTFCSISAKSLGKPWWGFSTFYGKPSVFSSSRGLNGGKRRLLQGRQECSPSPGAVIYTEGPRPTPWSLWGLAGNSPAMFAWMRLPSRWWIRPRCLCVCFVHFTCW